ncbi:hypothetical protein FGU65_09215 [Methanoculleus sp. FWC-SCC1]|uniref:Uncharacterized protein n=1 Tax=Methanoculleus frigidifontis TaxID=2584085 RepID=A0ABT8MAV2_9EURY|nr:hypothetical protein [Methanoculleus sp. FWC-SCC1]MDN7025063.1 hypothetical protein [Methanoculleus sp. FWC-SCC1]
MLLPVKVSPSRRVWADVSFCYEKQIYANSSEELSRYLLKYGRVNGVYEDEQIAYEIRRTVSSMLRRGVPHRQVVEEASTLYGIPEECVEEVVAAVPAENSTPG